MLPENAGTNIPDRIIPKIKNIIESASLIPLREVKNNPNIRGKIKSKNNPSNLSEE